MKKLSLGKTQKSIKFFVAKLNLVKLKVKLEFISLFVSFFYTCNFCIKNSYKSSFFVQQKLFLL